METVTGMMLLNKTRYNSKKLVLRVEAILNTDEIFEYIDHLQ